MKAHARLVAEWRDGRTVLRELRSVSPLTLVPRHASVGDPGARVVHMVNSASAPLGGDELRLSVRVGPRARLRLSGVAATLALPGPHAGGSVSTVDIEVGFGAVLEYLPEPTVVTARARHTAELIMSLSPGARLRTREVLVLGRVGEPPGRLRTTQRVVRCGVPLLHQTLKIGDPSLENSIAHLAGRRVLATELLVWGEDGAEPVSGDWWSLTPLAAGGSLIVSLAADAIGAERDLARARGHHPGWASTPFT
ncbi:urease accessory protein UreD [Amycolatopsis taiwanensis]|uniref:Urease accessory protein UreD n=1 Tax=Amycolatopsis taiwanensis TaxID=342230 RepID=A0A9W6VHZ4_9PSEU|nr:urease accessory protein UreD [Amycolatopsis taiwanensis]GLY69200.1 urease accessory protein UreD [Amycolatopsis taiwanensis]